MADAFADLAAEPAPAVEDMALALAAEFRAVDGDRARARLELLACLLDGAGELEPVERARACVEALASTAGFSPAAPHEPEALMLDRVLEDRSGDPLLLTIVYGAVANRAGIPLCPLGGEGRCLLGDPEQSPPLLVDPVPGAGRPDCALRWLCAHQVAMMILDRLDAAYSVHGRYPEAIKAAQLRLLLPLSEKAREQSELRLRSRQAALN